MVAKISEILTRAPSLNSCSRWLLGSSGKRIGNEVESIDEEKTPFRQDLFRLTYLTKKGAFFFPSCQLVLSLSQHRALSIHKPCTYDNLSLEYPESVRRDILSLEYPRIEMSFIVYCH